MADINFFVEYNNGEIQNINGLSNAEIRRWASLVKICLSVPSISVVWAEDSEVICYEIFHRV